MSPLACDTNGIRFKNYRVWLLSKVSNNWNNGLIAVGELLSELNLFENKNELNFNSQDKLSNALSLFEVVGECRADSIEVNGAKGNSIEGNVSGDITLNKTCSFSAELINTTFDNVEQAHLYDRKESIIILEEVDSFIKRWNLNDSIVETYNNHEIIIIGNSTNGYVLNIGESYKGQNVSIVPLSISKNVGRIGNFRTVRDVEYNVNDLIELADIYTSVNAGYKSNLGTYLASYDDEESTINIPSSEYMMFVEACYRFREYVNNNIDSITGEHEKIVNFAEIDLQSYLEDVPEFMSIADSQSLGIMKDLGLTALTNVMFGS